MPPIKLESASLFLVKLPLAETFQTSIGTDTYREFVVVSLEAEGHSGWGECVAMQMPNLRDPAWELYSYETNATAIHILGDILIPSIMQLENITIEELHTVCNRVRGHPMACAAVELALWDLFGRIQGKSFIEIYAGEREIKHKVEVGVSIGIQKGNAQLLNTIEKYLAEGYGRIKYKIAPGHDIEPIRIIRKHFPHVRLMVDCNGAYTLQDLDLFIELDNYDLLMIEQPLDYDNLIDHQTLQSRIRTPICLDESLHTIEQAKIAILLGACKIINIKPGRLGGMLNARSLHDFCYKAGIPVWCGGMLESGIGRSANLALAALPGFSLPNDISGTSRYYARDIALPAFDIDPANSTIEVPAGIGLGTEIDHEYLASMTSYKWKYGN